MTWRRVASRMLLVSMVVSMGVPVVSAAVTVTDDEGQALRFEKPPARIVSLAPHLTELLYDAGLGSRVVGTSSYSDYPEAARRLPEIGQHDRVNVEAIVRLQPALVLAWRSGNGAAVVDTLRRLGIPVWVSEPDSVTSVIATLQQLEVLAGNRATERASVTMQAQWQQLQSRYSSQPRVRVFVQIWRRPLMTVGGAQIMSALVHACGGINVYGTETAKSLTVNTEDVLVRDPQLIVSTSAASEAALREQWQGFSGLAANTTDQGYVGIDGDVLARATPRMMTGAQQLCEAMARVRAVK